MLAEAFGSIPGPVDAIGHRIVHGGKFHESALLTQDVRAAIQKQAELAPAHNPLGLAVIEAADRAFGADIPQIAVFDTAFHSTLAPAAYTYPGPYEWIEQGIRRYGFHGINHGYVARRAAQMLKKSDLRLITCHLGNGASLAAVKDGKSIDTTMGFTPVEGLMMGSRSGSVDPGILIYLMRHSRLNADQIEDTLNHKSGLLGISGVSADMREILSAIQKGDQRAQLAFDMYAHRLTREAGAMLAVLGGIDAFVFTGGVGENCPPLRDAMARQLSFCGLQLDQKKNTAPKPDQDVAAASSRVRALVVRAREEWEIALQCQQVLTY